MVTVFIGAALLAGPSAAQPVASARRVSPRAANYTIEVTLDPRTPELVGRERIRWRNTSARPAHELRFVLYYNVKTARSTTAGLPPMTVTSIAVGGHVVGQPALHPIDGGDADDRAVLAVPLPGDVPPGEEVAVELRWTARLPPAARGGGFFLLTHWFPQLGVLSDEGWICHGVRGGDGVYTDFGAYDVQITVPGGWRVAATGQPLQPTAAGAAARFVADDVHDFAWAASQSWIERTARAERRGKTPVDVRLLLQPEHAAQADHIASSFVDALEAEDRSFAPYPAARLTVVDVPWRSGAGAEAFPGFLLLETRWLQPRYGTDVDAAIARVLARHYWLQVFAPDPVREPSLHEGLALYSAARVVDVLIQKRLESPSGEGFLVERFFGGFVPHALRAIRFNPTSTGGSGAARMRQAIVTLERYLGWPTLQMILSQYVDRFTYQHPSPEDFFETAEAVSGRDLRWFFDEVYSRSKTFDYAVGAVDSTAAADGRIRSTIRVLRTGDGVFSGSSRRRVGPYQSGRAVQTAIQFGDGAQRTEYWDGRDASITYSFNSASQVTAVRVDPNYMLALDVNRTNNTWARRPRTATAATRWSARWMAWLEQALLGYAFFA